VLTIQSESFNQWRMFAYLIRTLKSLDVDYYVLEGNIYATKGKAKVYPCLVAHMDTVHDIVDDLTLLEVGDNLTGFNTVTMTQTGIGGDDKVGIYLALEVLRKYDNVKVAFFRDEEVGCHGSYEAYLDFFKDCSFVLQGDRRGNSDFVTIASGTKLSSKAFTKAMSKIWPKYGYKQANGMMTDVMALKEIGLNVSCANMSCGYYNPHMRNEYVNIPDVMNCFAMICEMIDTYGTTPFPHSAERSYYKSLNNRYLDDDYTYDKNGTLVDKPRKDVWKGFKPFEKDEADDFIDEVEYFDNKPAVYHCDGCQQSHPLTYAHEYNAYLCSDCLTYLKVRQ
jgi:putative aminopeptidase FrvX